MDDSNILYRDREGVIPGIEYEVDNFLSRILPTRQSNARRKEVIDYVAMSLQRYSNDKHQLLQSFLFGCGSTNLKAYLPESDIDAVFCASTSSSRDKKLQDNRISIFTIFNALCHEVIAHETEPHPSMTIRNVEFVNARTKVANCKINNLSVDVTLNQIGALASAAFLEEADRLIGCHHLFKRSLLLIKAWALHESPVFCSRPIVGSRDGMLSSYAISVLVLYLFNISSPFGLSHPFNVLRLFLMTYANFPWESHVITLEGPVPIQIGPSRHPGNSKPSATHANTNSATNGSDKSASGIFHAFQANRFSGLIERFKTLAHANANAKANQIEETTTSSSIISSLASANSNTGNSFTIRSCNIQDPIDSCNNLGYPVSRHNLGLINQAMCHGLKHLERTLAWRAHMTTSMVNLNPQSQFNVPVPQVQHNAYMGPLNAFNVNAQSNGGNGLNNSGGLINSDNHDDTSISHEAKGSGTQPRKDGVQIVQKLNIPIHGVNNPIPNANYSSAVGSAPLGIPPKAPNSGRDSGFVQAAFPALYDYFVVHGGVRADLLDHPLQMRGNFYNNGVNKGATTINGDTPRSELLAEGISFVGDKSRSSSICESEGDDPLSGDLVGMWSALSTATRLQSQSTLDTSTDAVARSDHSDKMAGDDLMKASLLSPSRNDNAIGANDEESEMKLKSPERKPKSKVQPTKAPVQMPLKDNSSDKASIHTAPFSELGVKTKNSCSVETHDAEVQTVELSTQKLASEIGLTIIDDSSNNNNSNDNSYSSSKKGSQGSIAQSSQIRKSSSLSATSAAKQPLPTPSLPSASIPLLSQSAKKTASLTRSGDIPQISSKSIAKSSTITTTDIANLPSAGHIAPRSDVGSSNSHIDDKANRRFDPSSSNVSYDVTILLGSTMVLKFSHFQLVLAALVTTILLLLLYAAIQNSGYVLQSDRLPGDSGNGLRDHQHFNASMPSLSDKGGLNFSLAVNDLVKSNDSSTADVLENEATTSVADADDIFTVDFSAFDGPMSWPAGEDSAGFSAASADADRPSFAALRRVDDSCSSGSGSHLACDFSPSRSVVSHWVKAGDSISFGIDSASSVSGGTSGGDRHFLFDSDVLTSKVVRYRWMHNGHEVPSMALPAGGSDATNQHRIFGNRNSVITIHNVTEADAGLYECLRSVEVVGDMAGAMNGGEGDDAVVVAQSRLLISKMPRVKSRPIYLELHEGSPLLLDLQYEGNPPPTFTWFKNGYLMENFTESTLVIDRVSLADSGTYFCKLSNLAGDAMWFEATVFIK